MKHHILRFTVSLLLLFTIQQNVSATDVEPQWATKCETCRLVTEIIEEAFRATDGSKEVIVNAKGA